MCFLDDSKKKKIVQATYLNSRVELSETFHSPSANRAVQTEMNTIRIVSANMVLMVVVSRSPQRETVYLELELAPRAHYTGRIQPLRAMSALVRRYVWRSTSGSPASAGRSISLRKMYLFTYIKNIYSYKTSQQ